MPFYRPIQAPEVSQNDKENGRWGLGQYLLGGLALFGVARALPRLIEQSPGMQGYFREELTKLANHVSTDSSARFFESLDLYTARYSGLFSSQRPNVRLNLLREEGLNAKRAFEVVNQNWNEREHRVPYFMEEAVQGFNRMIAAVRRVHDDRGTAENIFREWHGAVTDESAKRARSSSIERLTGMKHLTVQDALERPGLLPKARVQEIQGFTMSTRHLFGDEAAEHFLNLPLDHRVFVGHESEIVDMRGLMRSYQRVRSDIATEWSVPFVKINPFTIMGYNQYNTLENESFSWLFPNLSGGSAHYHLELGRPSRGAEGEGSSVIGFVGGRMLEVTRAGEFNVSHGWHLTTPGSQFGQHSRRMQGIEAQQYTAIEGHPLLQFAQTFKLFQQELEVEHPDILSPESFLTSGFNKVLDSMSPFRKDHEWETVHRSLPQHADPISGEGAGKREFRLAFRQSGFNLEQGNWDQLGRELGASLNKDPKNVTTATMIGYTTAYKVNVALNQIGLGLPVESMSSTTDFFRNLINYRVLPAMALFYGWRAINETMGDASPASAAAAGVKGWQDVVSGASTVLGLPDRLKKLGSLMPGIDQIAELPILPLPNNQGEISTLTLGDLLPVHMTLGELDDQRRYGMTAIRRGRYWSVGNVPYTGSDVIGYAPHWSRITNVDGDYRFYGQGPQRGNALPEIGDLPVVGSALAAIGSVISQDGPPSAGRPGYAAVAGPMGSVRLETAAGGDDGEVVDGVGGAGTGDGAGGAGGGRVFVPISSSSRDPNRPDFLPVAMASSAGRQVSDILGFSGFALRAASGIDFKRHAGPLAIGGIGNTLWHSQLGGFGGTVSEVFRRFFPEQQVDDSYDRTPSGMPSWLPGDGSFLNFQRGHAYEKVAMGKYVLPGPDFAELWRMGAPDLSLEAGSLGEQADAGFEHRTGVGGGDDVARRIAKKIELEQGGLGIHPGGRVTNAAHQVYTDVPFFIEEAGKVLPAFYAQKGQEDAARRRASFAAAQLGVGQAMLFTGEEAQPQTEMIAADHNEISALMYDADQKRSRLEVAMRAGTTNGMEVYHPAYRMLALASVAPNSDEYRLASKQVAGSKLTPELERVVSVARDMAENNRKRLRVYPYQFLSRNMKIITGTVEQVIDGERVLIQGMPNPVRLAGLQTIPGDAAAQAEEYLRSTLKPGTTVSLEIGAGDAWHLNKQGQTVRAVMRSGYLNVNRELMNMGLAVEDEKDDSGAGMEMRFTPGQQLFGAAWEAFAHLHTPFHTKMLQVRSPVEAYADREVFGKSFQSWDRPIDDYLKPTFESFAHHGLVAGTLLGAAVGYAFGSSPRGRLIFSMIGAAGGAATAAFATGSELFSRKPWTPGRREEQWDLEEYVDALKYVKSLRNFSSLAKRAKSEEDFDVYEYLKKERKRGKVNRNDKQLLEAKKRMIQEAGPGAHAQTLATEMQLPGEYATIDDLLKTVNRMLAQITDNKDTQPIGPLGAQALSWYQASKQTVQGWQPGDSIQDLIAALPATDRKYFSSLVDSQEDELNRLDGHAPRYLMRAIRIARGETAPQRAPMSEVFAKHGLPTPDWEGWRPEVSLGDVRIKIVKREGMDEHGMGIYPQEIEAANRSGLKNIPRFNDYHDRPNADQIEKRIRGILGTAGIEYTVDIVPGGNGLQVDVEHEQDRSGFVRQLLRQGGLPLS